MLFIQDCALVEHSRDTRPITPTPTSVTTEFLADDVLSENPDEIDEKSGPDDNTSLGQNDSEGKKQLLLS